LAVHAALETANRLGIGCELGAKYPRRGVPSRGTMATVEGREVQPNNVAADRMFGLLVRDPLQDQLHEVPLTPGVSSPPREHWRLGAQSAEHI
jgi:hypothetical protein